MNSSGGEGYDEHGMATPAQFGELGQSVEAHETQRIREVTSRAAVQTKPPTEVVIAAEAHRIVTTVIRSEMSGVRQAMNDLQHDIKSNSEIVKMLDVPLEQVADSHERATSSFERLRAEIAEVKGLLVEVLKGIK